MTTESGTPDHMQVEPEALDGPQAEQSQTRNVESVDDRIKSLASLEDLGIITEEEFERRKKAILDDHAG